MLVRRRDDARELAVLGPRRIEHLDAAKPVREDHALAVAVIAVIDERLFGRFAVRSRQGLAIHEQAVQEAVADGGELHEAAAPHRVITERLGIEAGGQLAALAEAHAHAARHGHTRAAKYATLHRA